MAVSQKQGNLKMGCPGKWNHGLKPAVNWWFNFDPYQHLRNGDLWKTWPSVPSSCSQLFSDPGKKREPFLGLGPFLVGQPPKKGENSWCHSTTEYWLLSVFSPARGSMAPTEISEAARCEPSRQQCEQLLNQTLESSREIWFRFVGSHQAPKKKQLDQFHKPIRSKTLQRLAGFIPTLFRAMGNLGRRFRRKSTPRSTVLGTQSRRDPRVKSTQNFLVSIVCRVVCRCLTWSASRSQKTGALPVAYELGHIQKI